ncbi:cytosine/adenosine deaminase-related metal-dependent hydrolase [Sulfitobacter undariae]|uniref:Cytosine/adenosine deaminase-related metal-dependent hydrolase n=1 Tax=Sulfitobacter undariae TaxID=1563671 RepID=A0A7W6ECH0_9RHOB|nr:chlorohydrolase family protein [Sulfitobacter undariae]MBB3995653.1 cytosine/adenosine deaminase-related metal-dependent hydrolase [Sulfitobacter undariae]
MMHFTDLPLGERPKGRWALSADWIVTDTDQGRRLVHKGEVVIENDRVLFVGQRFEGAVSARFDMGASLIAPGFVDLDALSDLDTTLLAHDNWPSERKGRVWPQSYIDRGPYEMYDAEELAFQKRFAFGQLLLNGITSAAPIASLFYRAWGETQAEFTAAADAAEDLGLRVWLGPAYRSGGMVVDDDGKMRATFDEARGMQGLQEAITFAEKIQGRELVSPILAPDRVETCTETLLKRTMAAADDLDCPVRLHMAQGQMELQTVQGLHGKTAPEWLSEIGCLSPRLLAPHATVATDADLQRYADMGVNVVHCPLVSARHGGALRSFSKLKAMGINIAMGTDTAPPDMVLNMAVGMMACRLVDGHTSVQSSEMYDAATVQGAQALGRNDIGVLRVGGKADLAVFDMADTGMAPRIDPIQTLILGATGRVTRATIVDGRLSMRDGEVAGIDMKAARVQAQAQFDRLLTRYPERTLGHPALSEMFPPSFPLMNGA